MGSLVDNAPRYGAGTIELKAVGGSDGTVEIHVLDKGRGFGNEFIDRAFERFSRGASGNRDGGADLWLGAAHRKARLFAAGPHLGLI